VQTQSHSDVAAFAAQVLPWLAGEPFGNNVVSTVVGGRAEPAYPVEAGAVWLTVHDDQGELAGVALMTPPRPALLGAMSDESAASVADWFVDSGVATPGVNGPVAASSAFRDRYVARTGVATTADRGTRLFRLERVDPPSGVPGTPRPIAPTDRSLLIEWMTRFHIDIHNEVVEDPATGVDQRLRRTDRVMGWLWEDQGEPVSMALLAGPVSGVSRIAGVYTPPDRRGHGYASACVAHASQHALDTGSTSCVLFTDLDNPTTNKIYPQVGYRPVADSQGWTFTR
jgi:GNAT superfamily N-acetyltransferase